MSKQKLNQTEGDLEEHLREQLEFLRRSADAYDQGFDGEAKRLAIAIRILIHDTSNSHSLLGQLGMRCGDFHSLCLPHDPSNLTPHGGLVFIGLADKDAECMAMLDDVPVKRLLPFDEWWNEVVFVDDTKEKLTRKQLVLAVANQDGGAHVDPGLDETYARLSRQNSMGWMHVGPEGNRPIPRPERAAMRQIAHEVLKTLLPGYTKQPIRSVGIIVGGMELRPVVPDIFSAGMRPLASPQFVHMTGVARSAPCPCGSKKKFKRCHGAG